MSTAHLHTPNQFPRPYRILIAQPEPGIREHIQLALRRPNFVLEFPETAETLLRAIASDLDAPSLVILDIATRKDELALLRKVRHRSSSLPIIMLSSASSGTNRMDAMESGANSFFTKPVSYEELRQAVDALLTSPPATIPRRSTGISPNPEPNLRADGWSRKTDLLLDRLAECEVPVLLQGETGVGKEVLARRIHNQSLRSGKIFLKLNCAALPSELVESELFGYEKGAFTGAFNSTPGKFELANGGTILLDEIGDMDLRLQAKLLQVLQDHEFHRIGAKESTKVDVRIIAATHRELESRIAQGEFREDLFYRLNVVNIVIPPLRERLDEIIPLAIFFLRKHTVADTPVPELGPALRTALLRHPWPGNIRELENVMRRYLVMRNPEMIVEELQELANRAAHRDRLSASNRGTAEQAKWLRELASPSTLGGSNSLGSSDLENPIATADEKYSHDCLHVDKSSELTKLDQVRQTAETEVIMKTLYSTQWNRKRAAALLGVDYKALLYKMKKLGID